jgi:DNA-binding LacI/PurR family transcriptional regulator
MGERRVDGLVLVPTSQAGSALKSQFPWHLPVVLLDRELADTEMSSVRCDSQAGTVLLCQHLIRLGHRRIAIVGGLPGVSTWEERVAGYRAALDGAHIPIVPELIIPGTYRGESGAGAVRRLCSGDGLPDVIVAANAQVAVGVLDTLVSAGYRVPDDVGVAAIDDPLPGSSFWPRLTVVEQPGYAMGHAAVELLIERLGQPKEQWESRHIVFPASLKLGTSCGEPFHDVHQARQTTP